jgi:hypothetical protein
MADAGYDSDWISDWANSQVHTDDASSSWKVISQVIVHFPDHSLDMGTVDDGRYHFTLAGPDINGTFYINPA